MPRRVQFGGVVHTFPDDATDEDIATALESVELPPPPGGSIANVRPQPPPPNPLEQVQHALSVGGRGVDQVIGGAARALADRSSGNLGRLSPPTAAKVEAGNARLRGAAQRLQGGASTIGAEITNAALPEWLLNADVGGTAGSIGRYATALTRGVAPFVLDTVRDPLTWAAGAGLLQKLGPKADTFVQALFAISTGAALPAQFAHVRALYEKEGFSPKTVEAAAGAVLGTAATVGGAAGAVRSARGIQRAAPPELPPPPIEYGVDPTVTPEMRAAALAAEPVAQRIQADVDNALVEIAPELRRQERAALKEERAALKERLKSESAEERQAARVDLARLRQHEREMNALQREQRKERRARNVGIRPGEVERPPLGPEGVEVGGGGEGGGSAARGGVELPPPPTRLPREAVEGAEVLPEGRAAVSEAPRQTVVEGKIAALPEGQRAQLGELFGVDEAPQGLRPEDFGHRPRELALPPTEAVRPGTYRRRLPTKHVKGAIESVVATFKGAPKAPTRLEILHALEERGLRPGSNASSRIFQAADAVQRELGKGADTVTLYHGEEGASGSGGGFWTTDPKRARSYGENVTTVDVPRSVFEAGQVEARRAGQAGPMDTYLTPEHTRGARAFDVDPDVVDATEAVDREGLFAELGVQTLPEYEAVRPAERPIVAQELVDRALAPKLPSPPTGAMERAIAEGDVEAIIRLAREEAEGAPTRSVEAIQSELHATRREVTANPGPSPALARLHRLQAELFRARREGWDPEAGALNIEAIRGVGTDARRAIKAVGDHAWTYYTTNLISRIPTVGANTANAGVKLGVGALVDVAMAASPRHRAALSERLRAPQYLMSDFIDSMTLIFDRGAERLSPGGQQLRALESFGMKHTTKSTVRTWSQFASDSADFIAPTRADRVFHAMNAPGLVLERMETAHQVRISMAPIMKEAGLAPGDYAGLVAKAQTSPQWMNKVAAALAQAQADAQALTYRRGSTRFKGDANAVAHVVEGFHRLPGFGKLLISQLTGQPFVNAFLNNAFADMFESAPLFARATKRMRRGKEYLALEKKAEAGALSKEEVRKLVEFRENAMYSTEGRRRSMALGPIVTGLGTLYFLSRDRDDLKADQIPAGPEEADGTLPVKSIKTSFGSLYPYFALSKMIADRIKGGGVEAEKGKAFSAAGAADTLTAITQQRGGKASLADVAFREGGEEASLRRIANRLAADFGATLPPWFIAGLGRDEERRKPELAQRGETPILGALTRGAKTRIPGMKGDVAPAYDPFTGKVETTGGLLPSVDAPFVAPEARLSRLERFVNTHALQLPEGGGLLPRQTGEESFDKVMFGYLAERLAKERVRVGGRRLTIEEVIKDPKLPTRVKSETVQRELPRFSKGAVEAAKRAVLAGLALPPLEMHERELRKFEEREVLEKAGFKGTKTPREGRPLRKMERKKWERVVKGLPDPRD